MRKISYLLFPLIFLFALLLFPDNCKAGCCGCDPVYDYSVKGEVNSAVWVRDQACVDTGAIIDTLQAGQVVQITHKTDGWYKVVSTTGKVGWSGEQFFTITDKSLTAVKSTEPVSSTEPKTTSEPEPNLISQPTAPVTSETSYSLARLKGYILLQVEDNGEAHYYYPGDNKRYYLGRPADAFQIMRDKGLGIKHSELTGYLNAKFPSRLSGKIMLDVEQNGEAYYVYPKDLKGYYLGRPDDAFQIMRKLGLGIINVNLDLISAGTVPQVLGDKIITDTKNDQPADNTADEPVVIKPADAPKFISNGPLVPGDGSFQKGNVPAGFNYAEINAYVLNRINTERTKRGKPPIVSDQRMVDTASVWAYEMFKQGQMTHTRLPKNMMAREWVWQNFKVEFAQDWGWLYENIGGGTYNSNQGLMDSVKASMDSLFDFYMAEEPYNGIHYQTIMHDQLTHVGIGFYFEGNDNSGQLYTVLHYGALWGQVPVINKIL